MAKKSRGRPADSAKVKRLLAEQTMNAAELAAKLQAMRRFDANVIAISEATILKIVNGKDVDRKSLQAFAAGVGVKDYRTLLKQPALTCSPGSIARDISSVLGDWEGAETQHEGSGGKPVAYAARLHLGPGGAGKAKGEYKVIRERTKDAFTFDVNDSSFDGRFLWLEYTGDRKAVRFGVCLLQLSDDGRTLEGGAVGHSTLIGAPTTATIKLFRPPGAACASRPGRRASARPRRGVGSD